MYQVLIVECIVNNVLKYCLARNIYIEITCKNFSVVYISVVFGKLSWSSCSLWWFNMFTKLILSIYSSMILWSRNNANKNRKKSNTTYIWEFSHVTQHIEH